MPTTKLTIKTPTLSLFFARRNSGKTYLMKHLVGVLARGKAINWVRVVTPTAFNGEWSAVVGEDYVEPEFDEEWLDDLLRRQADLKARGVNNPGLLILDDCLGAANFSSSLFTRIAAAGRHYGITVWASFQHYYKCPTVLRSNADYVFVLGRPNERAIRGLYEEFSPQGINTWQALAQYLERATTNHGAGVIDNTRGGAALQIRAPANPRTFRIAQ